MLAALIGLLTVAAVPAAATDWWLARDGYTADRNAVVSTLVEADFVLLGETHDNPHHHLAQADLLAGLVGAGRRPAVVWEMVSRDRQPAIEAWASGPRRTDPDAFAEAVAWAESGWPDWALYRPIAAVAVQAGLEMIAGNPDRAPTRAVGRGGLSALAAERRTAWGLDTPVPEVVRTVQLEAVFNGHCQLMPRERLAPMVDVQLLRDASMAAAMAAAPDGAVLIAGRGHVRGDVGVPLFLERLRPDARIVTVGLTEGPNRPGPFDWTRGFPAVDRPDPCEALRKHFQKSG